MSGAKESIFGSAGSRGRDLLFLAVTFGFSFFFLLGRLPLLEPDEARYAEIPREMLEKSDWVTPTLNYVKYFEKPPLHYWMNAISFRLFGQTEFAARFSTALFALLGVLLVYFAGRKLFGRRTALAGAVILGTSVGYVVQARYNIIDMTLAFTMTATLFSFILGVREEGRQSSIYFYLFYFFSALTVLAKGLIGLVLPGIIVFAWLLLTRRWSLLRRMRIPTGILLFLAVSAPWFILVSLRNPEFPRFFFIHEHFERFTSKVHRRYQPPWFFIPVLLGCMLPWALFIPAGIRQWWRDRRSEGAEDRLFLLLWFAVIFGFFSVSSSKLISYILPVFPPLALLLGALFVESLEKGVAAIRGNAFFVGLFLAIGGAGVVIFPFVREEKRISLVGFLVIGGLWLAEGVILFLAARMRRPALVFGSVAVISWLLTVVGPAFVLEGKVHRRSSKELGAMVREQASAGAKVFSFGYNQGVPFYAARRVVIVGDRNELDFGSRQGDQSAWFIDYPDFYRIWNSGSPLVVIVSEHDLAMIAANVVQPYRVVGKEGEKLLVSNR